MDQFLLESEHSGPGFSIIITYGPDQIQQNFEYIGSEQKIPDQYRPSDPYGPRIKNGHIRLTSGSNSNQIFSDHFYFPDFFLGDIFCLYVNILRNSILANCNQNVTRLLINEAGSFKVYLRTHVLLFFSLKRHNLLEF